MTALRTALTRRLSMRAHLREERALHRAVLNAPTLESAHEIRSILARH